MAIQDNSTIHRVILLQKQAIGCTWHRASFQFFVSKFSWSESPFCSGFLL